MKRIYGRAGRLCLSILFAAFAFSGCQKEKIEAPVHQHNDEGVLSQRVMNNDEDFRKNHKRLHWRTAWELLQARWATAKYRDIQRAIDDGYADIEVVVENMGHHFMKAPLSDAKFEITRPEILVYHKSDDGKYTLVAVEYAVPLKDSPKAPRGFFGDDDVWDPNPVFKLWLLHAWVWHKNPDGVFNPTNPLIHQH